ncbi:MAG TPA: glycosyltransferase family 4 protein [Ktedonobacteraceae bacterium]|jgi:glycosyltransferase involved in cell wall biosynthesis
MKIAQIAPPWIPVPPKNYGGTETVIAHLVEELVALKHEVTLFAPADSNTSAELVSFFPHSLADEGVPWEAHLKAAYHIFKSIEYIKSHHFDIVHIHLSSPADMYAFPLATSLTTPVVATLHSRFPFDHAQSSQDSTWTGDADEYYMEWLSSVPMVAISKSARAEVSYPLHFVGVVPHGLPMDVFKPMAEQPENFLAWLGRFSPDKGAHIAIQAAKDANMSLVLAGIIDDQIPEQVTYFEEMVKPHIDEKQISYIGPVNEEQKIDLLSRAKGFLNPIEWEEPFGMVMIEAMSVGCPVISFTRGAVPEVVADGISGFLVQDVQEMVQSVARLDELDRQKVRAYATKKFSVHAMARNYLKIYQKVIASDQLESSLSHLPIPNKALESLIKSFPVSIESTDPVASVFRPPTGPITQ